MYLNEEFDLTLESVASSTTKLMNEAFFTIFENDGDSTAAQMSFLNIFRAWCKQLATVIEEYKIRSKIRKRLYVVNRMMKRVPSLRKTKWQFRTFGTLAKDKKGYYIKDIRSAIDIAKNASAALQYVGDERMRLLINNYHSYHSGYDMMYIMTLEEAVGFLNNIVYSMNEELPYHLRELMNFDVAKQMVRDGEVDTAIEVKEKMSDIMACITNTAHIMSLNIDSVFHDFDTAIYSTMDKITDKYVIRSKKESSIFKELRKNSKKVAKMTYCNIDFDVYELPIKNSTCLNYAGSSIYVHNGFFELPIGFQEAILFHEIGHRVNGDFDNIEGVVDEEELFERFKKEAKKFDKIVRRSRDFRNDTSLNNDDELLYLLVELEADRFASRFVGKNIMRKTLTTHFDYGLDTNSEISDLARRFNKFRMKIRTRMI